MTASVSPSSSNRRVSAHLVVEVYQPLRVALQLAASAPGHEVITLAVAGVPIEPTEVVVPGNGRIHIADVAAGQLVVDYAATVAGGAAVPAATAADRLIYLRPSRYAESDRLGPIAQAEFAGIDAPADLLAAVSSWVGSRLRYVPGSSGPTDGAVDTLLKREGVCRDYAHLVIALLRALGVPARMAAVYAPGLDPMDFHAVAEGLVGEQWCAVDATLLAPRSSLVRIATGRDAADTAFLSIYGGAADLVATEVTAVTDGDLPGDDVTALVSLS